MGERIQQARKKQTLSRAQLAKKVGVSSGGCGHWERNFNTPSVENLVKLAVILNIRFEWLATGRGTMEYSEDSSDGFQPEREEFTPEDEQKLLEDFRSLPEKKRILVNELVRCLSTPSNTLP